MEDNLRVLCGRESTQAHPARGGVQGTSRRHVTAAEVLLVVVVGLLIVPAVSYADSMDLIQVEVRLLNVLGDTRQACRAFVTHATAGESKKINEMITKGMKATGVRKVRTLVGVLLTVKPGTFGTVTTLEERNTVNFYIRASVDRKGGNKRSIVLHFGYEEFIRQNYATIDSVPYRELYLGNEPVCVELAGKGVKARRAGPGQGFEARVCLVQGAVVDARKVSSRIVGSRELIQVGIRLLDAEGRNARAPEEFLRLCRRTSAQSINAAVGAASKVPGIVEVRTALGVELALQPMTPARVFLVTKEQTVDLDVRASFRGPDLVVGFGYKQLFTNALRGMNLARLQLVMDGVPVCLKGNTSETVKTSPDGKREQSFRAENVLLFNSWPCQ